MSLIQEQLHIGGMTCANCQNKIEAIIIALYVLLQRFGILNLLVPSRLADSSMGYGMLFVVGLLTSVHCIAMCGGINLSQCLPQREKQDDSGQGRSAFLPSFLYNAGRVVSYTAVGSLLGLVGMLLRGGPEAGIPVLMQGILKLRPGSIHLSWFRPGSRSDGRLTRRLAAVALKESSGIFVRWKL